MTPVTSWQIRGIDDCRRLREQATWLPASDRACMAIYYEAGVPASLARRPIEAQDPGIYIHRPIRRGGSPDRRVERGEARS